MWWSMNMNKGGRRMKDSLVIEFLCEDDRQHLVVSMGDDEFG